jgi:hypothetical protein
MTPPPILAAIRARFAEFLRLNPDYRPDAALLTAEWVREAAIHFDACGARAAAEVHIALADDLRAFANRAEALAPILAPPAGGSAP